MAGRIAIIGTGRLGATLAMALHRQGVEIAMVANRNAASAQQLAAQLGSCRAVDANEAAQATWCFSRCRTTRSHPWPHNCHGGLGRPWFTAAVPPKSRCCSLQPMLAQ